MKVIVLNYLSDPADDMSFSDCRCYTSKDDAQIIMKSEYKTQIEECEITDEDITSFNARLYESDYECSIYHYGSFYSWKIYEFEV